jgi:signal peptidase II
LTRRKLLALFTPAVIVVIIDQITKYIIRTTPELHRLDLIDGWLEFYYTQNSGMAMGIQWFPTEMISVISILATLGIMGYLLYSMEKAPLGYLIFMGLVLGGAFGNITDRLIMGFIEGHGGLLQGHVVDFIHFDLRIKDRPVFPYIFNVADIAISVSIISLIVFNKKLMPIEEEKEEKVEDTASTETNVSEAPDLTQETEEKKEES